MSEEKTRLCVKLGGAEIEYEGGCQFLKDVIRPTVGKILGIVESRAELQPPMPMYGSTEEMSSTPTAEVSHSTSTIATLLGAKSASDLAIAAAAHLTFVQKKVRLSRQEILDEMKGATSFFKSSYVNNHSNSLKVLIKADRLRQLAPDVYSLSQREREELKKLIAKCR